MRPLISDREVALIGVEAGGRGPNLGDNSATLTLGRPGVLQGAYSMLLQDEHGQIQETHSVSAGLDYPGVGPEHSLLMSVGRVHYEYATDDEALAALAECCGAEGIIAAIESAHAFASAKKWAASHHGSRILICLSGRGDKDMPTLQKTCAQGAAVMAGQDAGRRPGHEAIGAAIKAVAARGEPALVGFITAGFPTTSSGRNDSRSS